MDIGPPLITPDELTKPIGYECLLAAPEIYIGTISRVETVGPPRPFGGAGLRLIPVEIAIKVELGIQGTVEQGDATVYAYTFEPGSAPPAALPPFEPAAGERRLFFVGEQGLFHRLARDGHDYALRVQTGHHRALPMLKQGGTPERIARLLLTPAPAADYRLLAGGLERSAAAARAFCGLNAMLPILQELASHSDPALSASARFLYEQYRQASYGAGPLAAARATGPCPGAAP
jgi:hypothetical protein